ncbi:MAG: diaminopimelate decarboxylase [Caldisericia bacterium]|nr:diaminopimelate decarboxylase [Caldisericia bacterium]
MNTFLNNSLETIAIPTPFYLYSEVTIQKHIKELKETFKGVSFRPTFAVKSNANPYLLSVFNEHGIGADVISRGEFYAAAKGKIPSENMVWNGNAKTEDDMGFFSENSIKNVNVDSFDELVKWSEVSSASLIPSLFLRVNPAINVSTHPFIATGSNHHKFGIPLSEIDHCLQFAKVTGLRISGFHVHIGSQITDYNSFKQAYGFIATLAKKHNLSEVNIGGGWGIPYYDGKELDLVKMKKFMKETFKSLKVWCEMGRFLIGEAGWYVSRVIENRTYRSETICITDGGMNHLLRPSLYGAHHSFSCTDASAEKGNVKVMGRLCESGDVLVPPSIQPIPKVGSLIAIHQSGAYGFSMANHYNGFPLPAEIYLFSDGNFKIIRKAETVKELLRNTLE